MKRKTKLDLNRYVYITDEAYENLRALKKINKQSMAQIATNLIKEEYEDAIHGRGVYEQQSERPILTDNGVGSHGLGWLSNK